MRASTPSRRSSVAALVVGVLLAGCGSSTSSTSTTSSKSTTAAAKANAADKAFVSEMIPNDQLAVEMAKLAQTNAQHSQLKPFANQVINTTNGAQVAPLTTIATALGVTPLPTKPTTMTGMENAAGALGIQMYQLGMDQVDPTALASAKPFDKSFLTMMISDDNGAVTMARAELSKGTDSQLRAQANTVVATQGKDVTQLKKWQSMWYGKKSTSSGMKGMPGMKTTTTGTSTMNMTTTTTG